MKYSTLLFLSLLSYNSTFSQKATVSGKVTDFKKEGLPGVSIIADSSSVGSVSDATGSYSFSLESGKHVILFKMIGMTEKGIPVELKDGETKIVNVILEESAKELGLVVVSAGKFEQKIEEVTVSMNVITPSLVENRNTTSMEEILDQVPSVNIMDNQANIRGGSGWSYGAGSRVQVLVDDLPVITADAGDVKWNFLPLENLEQIEVIKGASSALYGSSALDGVINIRTAYPKETPETKISFYSGVYDQHQKIKLNDTTYNLNWPQNQLQKVSGLNFLHSRKIKNLDIVLGGNIFLDDGYRLGEYEQHGRFNANLRYHFKNIEGLSCGMNFNTMVTQEGVFFIWQNDTTGAYMPLGGTDTATTTLSDVKTHRTNIDPFVTYVDKKGNAFKLRTRYFRTNNLTNTDQDTKADVYYKELQYQKRFNEKYTASVGVVQSNDKVTAQLYGNHQGDNLAFYAQGDAKIRKFIFSFGGRVERSRLDSLTDKFIPVFRAGVNYHAFGATYLRSSFGQGYRYPSISEKYVSTSISVMKIFPNPSLKSERGYAAEAGVMQGIKIGGWKGYVDVAAFYTEYHNMIEFTFSQWDVNPPPFGSIGFKALNIGNTRIKGIDASLNGEGSIGTLHITVLAGYTFMEPLVLHYDSNYIKAQHTIDSDSTYGAYLGSDSSNFLKYRFNHLAKADLAIRYKKFAVGFGMRYNSFMRNIDKLFVNSFYGRIITPGVTHYRKNHKMGDIIYDARASYQLTKDTKLALIVKNVFNYIYMQRPADMQPPRTWTMQATIAF